jgi:hypothetical protein
MRPYTTADASGNRLMIRHHHPAAGAPSRFKLPLGRRLRDGYGDKLDYQ